MKYINGITTLSMKHDMGKVALLETTIGMLKYHSEGKIQIIDKIIGDYRRVDIINHYTMESDHYIITDILPAGK